MWEERPPFHYISKLPKYFPFHRPVICFCRDLLIKTVFWKKAWLMELVYSLLTSIPLLKGMFLPMNALGHSFGQHTLKTQFSLSKGSWVKSHVLLSKKKKKVPTFMIPTLMELLSTLRTRIIGLKFPRSMEINVFFIGKNGCPPNIIDILWNLF